MTRTRLSAALGLALFAAGCPAETPPPATTPAAPAENLGAPESGSSTNKGAPVAPAAAPADAPAATPPAAPPADAPAATPAAPPADAPAATPAAPPAAPAADAPKAP
jgi:hypothetical protein